MSEAVNKSSSSAYSGAIDENVHDRRMNDFNSHTHVIERALHIT